VNCCSNIFSCLLLNFQKNKPWEKVRQEITYAYEEN
jgi:hypothetical protein